MTWTRAKLTGVGINEVYREKDGDSYLVVVEERQGHSGYRGQHYHVVRIRIGFPIQYTYEIMSMSALMHRRLVKYPHDQQMLKLAKACWLEVACRYRDCGRTMRIEMKGEQL